MRRKSARNANKATPEKVVKEVETPVKTRRSRRRKRSPSKSSESEEEVIRVTRRAPLEDTPDTTTKSHSPSDEETSQEPMWKVTSSDDAPQGEIQKLKICLRRPVSDSPDKSKTRRSKSRSQTEDDATTSSEDKSSTRQTRSRGSSFVAAADDDVEEKKGKGKSKGKHKSKLEQSTHLNDENEIMPSMNIEISENAQVTSLSPTIDIDKPVDNENDHKNKVVEGDTIVCVSENAESDCANQEEVRIETVTAPKNDEDNKQIDSDEDEPLSVIQKVVREEKHEKVEEDTQQQTPQVQEREPEEVEAPEEVKPPLPATQEIKLQVEAFEEAKPQLEAPEEAETQVEASKGAKPQVDETEETEKPEIEANIKVVPQETMEDTQPEEVPEPVSIEGQSPQIQPPSILDEEEPMEISTDISFSIDPPAQTENNEQIEPPASVSAHLEQQEKGGTPDILQEQPPKREEPKIARKALIRRDLNGTDTIPLNTLKEPQDWSISFDTSIKIDLESLTSLYPDIQFPSEPDLIIPERKERRRSQARASIDKLERTVSIESSADVSTTSDSEDKTNIIAFNRKISIVDDTASKLKPPPSPAKNPVADVLYITNLVRPFTLKQLKELLERTGKIQEDGFWTDRIKSKCYVHYTTQEEAEATRNALHGVQWPIGNGKKLMIEYATSEDLENAKNPPPPPPVPELKAALKENVEPVENIARDEERKFKDEDRKKELPMREWDIGKEMHVRERSRSRDRSRKHRRTPSPVEDFITKKHRKEEESVPQKLMDDLFLKTKSTPSIYWQPLSPEEIAMKQQQRLVRMEEHKRRMEENSRMKGRDGGGGGGGGGVGGGRGTSFRRRYD